MKAPEVSKIHEDERAPLRFRRGTTLQFRNAALLLLVSLAALGTFVVTPRPTRTRIVPLPLIDASALRARETEEKRRALEVHKGGLPVRARIIGEEFRRLGVALRDGHGKASSMQRELARDVSALVKAGHVDELLNLRALQAEFFVRAVRAWESSGNDSLELRELGGDFASTQSVAYRDTSSRLTLNDDQLRLLFRVRWGRLTGVHRRPAFGPTLEEFRRFYSLQLQRPYGGATGDPSLRIQAQLESAGALAALDPDYPGDLARGILLLHAGEAESATEVLKRYRTSHSDGPWSAIARNVLLSAATQASQSGPW